MATVRRFDGMMILESGEFPQLPEDVKRKLSYQLAGTMDNYVYGMVNFNPIMHIPMIDALRIPAIIKALEIRNSK